MYFLSVDGFEQLQLLQICANFQSRRLICINRKRHCADSNCPEQAISAGSDHKMTVFREPAEVFQKLSKPLRILRSSPSLRPS